MLVCVLGVVLPDAVESLDCIAERHVAVHVQNGVEGAVQVEEPHTRVPVDLIKADVISHNLHYSDKKSELGLVKRNRKPKKKFSFINETQKLKQ